MFGVFQVEWQSACRRSRHRAFRAGFTLLILAELLIFLWSWLTRVVFPWHFIDKGHPFPPPGAAAGELGWDYFIWFAWQQLLLIVLATPALAAGSIADEKARGTLALLLTSDLTPREIVLGKWAAHVVQVITLTLPAAPALVYFHALAGLPDVTLLAFAGESLLLTTTLAAVGLLASVWCRKTTSAVFALYALLTLALVVPWLFGVRPLGWLALQNEVGLSLSWLGVMATLAGLSLLCLLLAIRDLRPAYERQLTARPRGVRRLAWLQRPAVNDTPIRWKERFVGELGLFAFCRHVPRWFGLALVLAFGWLLGDGDAAFITHGLGLIAVTGLWTAVRGSGVITGERENQTWESLLLTPLDPYTLVRGKLWGVIDGLRPYLVAYLAVALLWAVPAGVWATFCTVYCWLVSWAMLYYQGANAVNVSAHSSGSWPALLKALTTGAWTYAITLPVVLVALLYLSADFLYWGLFGAGVAWIMLVLFGNAETLLEEAERHIARAERVEQLRRREDPSLGLFPHEHRKAARAT